MILKLNELEKQNEEEIEVVQFDQKQNILFLKVDHQCYKLKISH